MMTAYAAAARAAAYAARAAKAARAAARAAYYAAYGDVGAAYADAADAAAYAARPAPDANVRCICGHAKSEHEPRTPDEPGIGGRCLHHTPSTDGFRRWLQKCPCLRFGR